MGNIYCFIFQFTDSFLNWVLKFWMLHFSVLKFPFGSSLYLLFLCWDYFFIYFKYVLIGHWNIFLVVALKSLSDHFNFSVMSAFVSIGCLFSFNLRSSWFLIWWVIFDWNFWSVVKALTPCWHPHGGGRGPHYCQVEVEVLASPHPSNDTTVLFFRSEVPSWSAFFSPPLGLFLCLF